VLLLVLLFPGMFALIQAYAFLMYVKNKYSWSDIKNLVAFVAVACAGIVFLAVVGLTYMGMYDT
jgi:hypothetical protein